MFIIFGWNHEIRTNYGPVEEIICANCTIKDYWILEKSKVYFTLFFIPIFSYKTNLEYYCPRCKECVQLDETTFSYYQQIAKINTAFLESKINDEERVSKIALVQNQIKEFKDNILNVNTAESKNWEHQTSDLSNEELIQIVNEKSNQYNPSFIIAAENEIKKRNLN